MLQAFTMQLGNHVHYANRKGASRINGEDESRNECMWGGLTRSSKEVSVMEMEPRGELISV